ncbi:MAG: ribonuclease P protein component [Candidatus Eremiobacteraeota bacterium]|nr:ribonuclease P protein component [Candidatus Eremiobacteraeota bacterium]
MRWCGRLQRSSEIAHVRRRGRRANAPTLTAYAAETSTGGSRLAVTVSKALGGAVVRNRVRRRIRSAFEALRAPHPPLRILVIMKPGAADRSYGQLAADVADVLERLAGHP